MPTSKRESDSPLPHQVALAQRQSSSMVSYRSESDSLKRLHTDIAQWRSATLRRWRLSVRPRLSVLIRDWCNGNTAGFEPALGGPSPPSRTIYRCSSTEEHWSSKPGVVGSNPASGTTVDRSIRDRQSHDLLTMGTAAVWWSHSPHNPLWRNSSVTPF